MFNFFSNKKATSGETLKCTDESISNQVTPALILRDEHSEEDYKDISLECTSLAKEIFSDKFEGICVAVLTSYLELLKIQKFRGIVNFVKKGITSLELVYNLNVEISFEARIGSQIFNGIMILANLVTNKIENETIRVNWTGTNLPKGIMFQQCDSLIKTSRVKNLLTQQMKEFEESCMTTFAKRYNWVEYMPVKVNTDDGKGGKVVVEYD